MDILSSLSEEFRLLNGSAPELVCFAPGRVNLIGEHTDYNGGHVFPCALSLGTWVAAARRNDGHCRYYSMNFSLSGLTDRAPGQRSEKDGRDWTRYPEGVIETFRAAGYPVDSGLDLVYYGNIPSGSGLSSSASLEVATGTALRELFGLNITLPEIARLSQTAENSYVGVNCGIMDQFASAMGKRDHAIFLDTGSLHYRYAPLKLQEECILICNSKVKHSLASSGYNDRRRECEEALRDLNAVHPLKALCELSPEEFDTIADKIQSPVCRRRAKHAVYENARTRLALQALERDNLSEFGRLMNESHVSLRDDYEVSCPEIDLLTELAWKEPGVLGSRITGGGFGGCTVSIVKSDAVESIKERITLVYTEKTALTPEFYIASPDDGARRLL